MLLRTWPYLTRMFTTLSPIEMNLDPEFVERDDLAGVRRISLSAIQRVTCQSQAGVTLPDNRSVALPARQTWPLLPTTMPFAERIEEIPAIGAPMVLKDNTDTINAQLKMWNDSQSWPPPDGTTIGGTGTAGGPTGGSAGSNGASPTIDHGSCGCRAVGSKPATSMPWALLGLAGLARARRRRGRTET
jgi:MYXO-CTERM domain-containing protein